MGKCSMCGRECEDNGYISLQSHHIIPRWFDGIGSDIIEICRRCHVKTDSRFVNLVIDPFMKGRKKHWINHGKNKDWHSRYHKRKQLTILELEDKVNINISLTYNIRTDHYYMSSQFYWKPKWSGNRLKNNSRRTLFTADIGSEVKHRVAIDYNKITHNFGIENFLGKRRMER